VATEASTSSPPFSAIGHPELAKFSSRQGKFVGTEINVKVSVNESQPASAPERSATETTPVAADPLNSGLRSPAVYSARIQAAPKPENQVNAPAKGILHSVPISNSVTTEVDWQKGNEPEAASANPPLASSAKAVPPQQLDVNMQPATPAANLQKDAPPETNGLQPSGAAYVNSGESGAYTILADASTSGQGKSGQQGGLAPGSNPAGVITIVPSPANNPVADSTANLLTAHAPSVPVSHANTSAAQTTPSTAQPATTLSAWQNYDGGAGKIVRSASLSDTANGAEMHLELRSGALGPLEVHAVLNEGSVGAEIHVQGPEAHTLLAAGLPSLERALGDRNLRVENIAVYQDQAGGGMSGGAKQDPQSGSYSSAQHAVLPWDNPSQPRSAARGSAEDDDLADPATGLSVRA
jgi:flagellar hook-length control protein FliK